MLTKINKQFNNTPLISLSDLLDFMETYRSNFIHIQFRGTRLIETHLITVFLPIENIVLSQYTDTN
jgi:hypothetical protein